MLNDNRVNLLGCPINNLTLDETLSIIIGMIKTRNPHQHVVVNVNKLVELRRNPVFKEIIVNCDIINADGMPLVWASRILGIPLKERVTGIDLMQSLLKKGMEEKYSFYFLGAREWVVKKVVQIVKDRYPAIQMAGFRNGYWFTTEEEIEAVEAIKKAHPDILFIAMSSPKKEVFLKKYLNLMQVPFAIGVGGSFDVIAGITKRAPVWMQKAGLEWLFRLIQEPRRLWKRYLFSNTLFAFLVVKELFKERILRIK